MKGVTLRTLIDKQFSPLGLRILAQHGERTGRRDLPRRPGQLNRPLRREMCLVFCREEVLRRVLFVTVELKRLLVVGQLGLVDLMPLGIVIIVECLVGQHGRTAEYDK